MKLKTKLSKLRHDGHITDAEYSIIINVLNKFSTQQKRVESEEAQFDFDKVKEILKRDDLDDLIVDHTRKIVEDCVSRAEVHDLLATWLSDYLTDEIREVLETIDGKVEDMPSVTPSRPIGHWINLGIMPSELGNYRWCSNCDCGIDAIEFHRNHYNYCPDCGAYMRENEE